MAASDSRTSIPIYGISMKNRINLLIKNNVPIGDLPDKVIESRHIASSDKFSASKSRGTKIKKEIDGFSIAAWQVILVRFQNMDQYQPMSVALSLDENFVIRDIRLDQRSVGSQGLTCSMKYLQRNLNQTIGLRLNKENTSLFLSSKLHCFHLQELLLGAMSFIEHYKMQSKAEFDEVETLELLCDGNDFITRSLQRYGDGSMLEYQVKFHNILKNIVYGPDGYLGRIENVDVEFFHDDRMIFRTTLEGQNTNGCNLALYKLTLRIWEHLSRQTALEPDVEFCHTCSYPFTMMGLITLGMAAKLFVNNYNYVVNVVRACQRPNNKPVCVGVIQDVDEGRRLFPDLRRTDIY